MTVQSKQVFPTSVVPAAHDALVRIAAGAGPTQIVPAPPAGYFTWLWWMRVNNENTTVAADPTVEDASGQIAAWQGTAVVPARGVAVAPAVASFVSMSLTAQAFSSGAVTGTVTLGGPCVFTALYTYIPIGEFAQVVLALTAVYQAVALAPASATQLAVQYGQLGSYSPGAGLLPSNATIMNNDTAIANVVFRLTRGAFVNEVTLGNIAARSRNSISPVLPALILGDVLEVKALTAPVVPGSVVLRFPYLRVPLQS